MLPGTATSLYYSWSKELRESGKNRLAGDTACQATSPEVKGLCAKAAALKEALADLTLEHRLVKNTCWGGAETYEISSLAELEIIRLVELSHLPVKRTLDKLASPKPQSIVGMTGISCLVMPGWRIIALSRTGPA